MGYSYLEDEIMLRRMKGDKGDWIEMSVRMVDLVMELVSGGKLD